MKLDIDREVCIGSGMCVFTVPEVFDQDDDEGRVLLRTDPPPQEFDDAVRRAVAGCPSGALSIR